MTKGKVTLQMLAESMAANTGRSKSATEQFVRTFFAQLKDALQSDNIVKIKGFGTFKLVVVAARESVNVNTGERVSIAEYNKITFTPDKQLKDRINRPFAQFETINLDSEEDFEIIASFEAGEGETASAVAQTPSPVVEEPKPVSETPAPVAETPAPVAETPAPVAETPAPVAEEPKPETVDVQPHAQVAQTINATTINAETINATCINTTGIVAPVPAPSAPEAETEDVSQPEPRSKTKRAVVTVLLIFLALLLIVAAYFAGSRRLFHSILFGADSAIQNVEVAASADTVITSTDTTFSSSDIVASSADTAVTSPAAAVTSADVAVKSPIATATSNDTASVAPKSKPTIAELRAEASKYPQLEGGRYLMVGVKTTRKVVWGSNLIYFCRQIYGKAEYFLYVVKFNEFADPNNIPIGTVVKFPELIPK